MKRILLPTDFSPHARQAFLYACQLTERFEPVITLFHVYIPTMLEPYTAPSLQQSMLDMEEAVAHKQFEEMAASLPVELKDKVKLEFRLKAGAIVEEILFAAEEHTPDLIVMGIRGASSATRGSKSRNVLLRTQYPVLVVPETAIYRPPERIAYALNFQDGEKTAVRTLLDFAKPFGACIHAIHIRRESPVAEQTLMEHFERAFESEIDRESLKCNSSRHPQVIDGLADFVEKYSMDMIAMLTAKRNFFERVFGTSFTNKMAHEVEVPLLSLHS